MKTKLILFLLALISLCSPLAGQSVDQAQIDRQVSYFNSQIKKNIWLAPFSANYTVITPAQYEVQKPSDAFSFDCGYLGSGGAVFVSEPTTTAQKNIFRNITEAALYYVSRAYVNYYFETSQIPFWFSFGFAAFEADLNITDAMIADAVQKYGGSLPSYANLNNRTLYETNNGIAISYFWGEMMNISFGWWKYARITSFTSDSFTTDTGEKTPKELHDYCRRLLYARIQEPIERFRIKQQPSTEHFRYYYRDNESYCMPYMGNVCEEAFNRYITRLGVIPSKKLNYTFNLECEGAKIDSTPCPNRYTGGTGWAAGIVSSCADKPEDLHLFRHLIIHELAHTFQFLIKPNFMPAWLSEGWASFLPDGLMTEQMIKNESGFAIYKVESAKEKLGRYPTILELEDYDFLGRNGIDYYLFGLLMNDFVVKRGGYAALVNLVKTNGQDFSLLGYSTKQEFETGFYDYYNTYWKEAPRSVSIKKTNGKPRIDGILSEPVWENDIIIDRKFWTDSDITIIPTIDNNARASMLWDEDNLYIAMKIEDSDVSDYWYNDLSDGIEVDIDPDLSRGLEFKNNDFALIWNTKNNAPNYRTTLNGADAALVRTSDGYTVEISIPWSNLGVSPTAGKKIGFELFNFDSDGGNYKGTYIYSGHSWMGGVSLNGIAEAELSSGLAKKGIDLASPRGGEVFIAGEPFTVEFSAFNVSNIKVELSSDGGNSWTTLAAAAGTNSGTLQFLLPEVRIEQGKIRITDASDNTTTAMSPGTFRVVPPSTSFGPYIKDSNTLLLLHFNNNLLNTVTSETVNGTGLTYGDGNGADMGSAARVQNSLITIPHNSNLNLGGDWTIEAWIKLNSYNGNGMTIITKPGNDNAYFANYTLEINPWWNNVFYGFFFDGSNNRVGLTGAAPELNKWYHIAFIRDSQRKQMRLLLHDSEKRLVSTFTQDYSVATTLLNTQAIKIGDGIDGWIDEIRISSTVRDFTVGIEDKNNASGIPLGFSLAQNYPNPFNPATTITFNIPVNEAGAGSAVILKIYDSLGREIKTLLNGPLPGGSHSVKFDASGLPSGIYFYRLNSGSFSQQRKMVLLK